LLLQNEFNQSGVIVTYRHDDPLNEITRFRTSDTQWIVSVGMVSEGTDIPRLQVCCHLSHIKTELYFRQVLGRILRISDAENQEAWLYTIAESQLSCFAERIAEDLPDKNTVIRLDRSTEQAFYIDNICGSSAGKLNSISAADKLGVNIDWGLGINQSKFNTQDFVLKLGTFKQRLLSVFLD